MFDFWTDMSYGKAVLADSAVYGWFELTDDYTGSGANPAGRDKLLADAKAAARQAGVDMDNFNTLVVLNRALDLFGGPGGAVGGDDGKNLAMAGLAPSLIGQEMGHVYGLNHSRMLGSEAEYQDPWDIMSTGPDTTTIGINPDSQMNQIAPNGRPVYGVGPGMNAANMWSLGWLDESRVWNEAGDVDVTISLRPLHQREREGYLAARFGEYFIELRVPERWDVGIGEDPVVLVHVFEGGRSYLVADSAGNFTWRAGSKSGIDGFPEPPASLGLGLTRIQVGSIDADARTATISLTRIKGAGPEKHFPEWWPRRKAFDLTQVRPDDAVLLTQGRELVVEGPTSLAREIRVAVTRDLLGPEASGPDLTTVARAIDLSSAGGDSQQ